MSSNPAARTLRLPPANFSGLKIPRTRQPARNWFRVHQSGFAATCFSLSTNHRFSHQDCPYPFLYLGVDTDTCLFERFGDTAYDGKKAIPQTLWEVHSVSMVQVPEIQVCDLTNAKTLSAMMTDLSALMHNDISAPRDWGLAIQKHPANFQAIKFRSRFNGKACLGLFQRDSFEKRLREKVLNTLANDDAAVNWLDKHKVSLY
jgi:RES domain-containing protein